MALPAGAAPGPLTLGSLALLSGASRGDCKAVVEMLADGVLSVGKETYLASFGV